MVQQLPLRLPPRPAPPYRAPFRPSNHHLCSRKQSVSAMQVFIRDALTQLIKTDSQPDCLCEEATVEFFSGHLLRNTRPRVVFFFFFDFSLRDDPNIYIHIYIYRMSVNLSYAAAVGFVTNNTKSYFANNHVTLIKLLINLGRLVNDDARDGR